MTPVAPKPDQKGRVRELLDWLPKRGPNGQQSYSYAFACRDFGWEGTQFKAHQEVAVDVLRAMTSSLSVLEVALEGSILVLQLVLGRATEKLD